MKVNLTKSAEFDFNESKYNPMPYDIFKALVGEGNDASIKEALPEMVVFENREEYLKNKYRYNFDESKSVHVSSKGQIFIFIDKSVAPESASYNASDDSKQ